MKAKKAKRDYKFRDSTIYVNDHLTSHGKNLFREAKTKKGNLDYKYLWTRDGKIFMRKNDNSEVIHITCLADITTLT